MVTEAMTETEVEFSMQLTGKGVSFFGSVFFKPSARDEIKTLWENVNKTISRIDTIAFNIG